MSIAEGERGGSKDPLEPSRAALIAVSAALARREDTPLDRALQWAQERCEPLAVEEVILQSHLFGGFPLTLEGMRRWRSLTGPTPSSELPEGQEEWARRGVEICARVYDRAYEQLRANVRALHPDLDRWMVEGGYGRVIGRPNLDLPTRELCIVAFLAGWNAPRQLRAHLHGALNVGARESEVARALEIGVEHLEAAGAEAVLEVWRGVREGRGAGRQRSEPGSGRRDEPRG